MLPTIIGIILLASPFLLSLKFRDKRLGIVYVLTFVITGQLLISIFTQIFGIFTYPVILTVNVIVALFVFLKMRFHEVKALFKKENLNWFFIIMIIVVFVSLYNVHYNYSGKYTVAIASEYYQTDNLEYPYPYFSDEWYAVALVNKTLETHILPVINPLIKEMSIFLNFELAFHSFLSEIILLLQLDAITDYTKITIITGLFIIILIFLFLRVNNIGSFSAATAGLAALYITNGANLPGLWNLLPLTMGILSLFLGLIFLSINKIRMSLLTGLLTLLFYPPLVIFYTIALFLVILKNQTISSIRKRRYILDYVIILFFSSFFFLSIVYPSFMAALASANESHANVLALLAVYLVLALLAVYLSDVNVEKSRFKKIFYGAVLMILLDIIYFFVFFPDSRHMIENASGALYYPTFTVGFIPEYAPWHVLPLPVLILALLGIYRLFKNYSWFVMCIVAGLLFWLIYSLNNTRLIIEYQRDVFITSLLMIAAFGFGLNYIVNHLQKLKIFTSNKLLVGLQIGVLLLFMLAIPRYTTREEWKNLTLKNINTSQVFWPAAPANQYLEQDDLRIFKNIHNKNFLSPPWKGTVIGVATDNYPLSVKPGTITLNSKLYSKFQKFDCEEKHSISKDMNIDLVYSLKFNCPHFEFVDESAEGLVLYEVKE